MIRLLRLFVAVSGLAAILLCVPLTQAATVTPEIQAGAAHSIALNYNGTVWTWGSNSYGQLGNGTFVNSSTPVQVKSLSNVVAIAAGFYHNLAIKSDGSVWAWGSNANGQLGNNTTVSSNVPVEVMVASGTSTTPLTNAYLIAAGYSHSLIATTGGVMAVGLNASGQLGDGTNTQRLLAVPIAVSLPHVTALAAGRNHSVALYNGGLVATWGDNTVGQLGDGTFVNNNMPTNQAEVNPYTQISSRDSTTLALDNTGIVWAWGANNFGQIGSGSVGAPVTPAIQSNLPAFCPMGSPVITSIASGANSSMAIAVDGSTIGWGDSTAGELSNIPPSSYACATGLPSVSGETQLAAGVSHTLAYMPAGTVIAFGDNSTGQLGNGTTTNSPAPVNVLGAGGVGFLNLLGLANLSVTVAGSGTINSAPAGLTCSTGTCVGSFSTPSTVILTATPSGGNVFQGWGGACSGTGTCTVNITGTGISVTATFSGNGSGGPVSGVIPATGWWWNPAEPGRGFMIEESNGEIFMATFLYAFSGEATWFGSGPAGYGSGNYTGVLNLYGNGQTLTGAYQQATLVGGSFGSISINFTSATTGTLTWPEGTIPIERFNIVAGGSTATIPAGTPQAGWWWNPSEGGRGFSLEIQDNTMLIAGYMYDNNGNPIWYSSQGAMSGMTYLGNWEQYGYGQTLTGSYQPASVVNSDVGALTIQFSSPTAGTMTLPNGRQIPIIRFLF